MNQSVQIHFTAVCLAEAKDQSVYNACTQKNIQA